MPIHQSMTVEEFLGINGRPQKQKVFSRDERQKLELNFLDAWKVIGIDLPKPVQQHKFHPTRKWRFDFAFIDQKVAVEIQGGSFSQGGHNRGTGQDKDHKKINEAQKLGWMVLQFGTKAMDSPYSVAVEVADVIRARISANA